MKCREAKERNLERGYGMVCGRRKNGVRRGERAEGSSESGVGSRIRNAVRGTCGVYMERCTCYVLRARVNNVALSLGSGKMSIRITHRTLHVA